MPNAQFEIGCGLSSLGWIFVCQKRSAKATSQRSFFIFKVATDLNPNLTTFKEEIRTLIQMDCNFQDQTYANGPAPSCGVGIKMGQLVGLYKLFKSICFET